MQRWEKWAFGALLLALLAAIGWGVWQGRKSDALVRDLQNKIAEQAVTIQVKDQVYEKLAVDQKNLEKLVDQNTKQGAELAERLKETKSRVASLSTALIEANGKLDRILDKPVVNPDSSWTSPVAERTGPLYLRGTITAGPTANDGIRAKLDYGIEDLRLDLAISQNPDGSWKADAAVPEPVKLVFGRVQVNSRVLQPRWYERVNFTLQALGNSREALGAVGAGYRFSSLNVYGLVGAGTAGENHVYYGAGVTWYPLEK